MIYCPKCGTANRDGSRFCNECGQGLGTLTRVKCPECGAMNPVQHAFCSECGGRLLPPSAESVASDTTPTIKGLSLPTVGPVSAEEEESATEEPAEVDDDVPAWLRELGTRWPAESRATEVGAGEDSSEVPDWLKDLRSSLPDDQEADWLGESQVPEWLSAMQPPAGAEEQSEELPLAEAEEQDPARSPAEVIASADDETKEPEEVPAAEVEEPEPEAVTTDQAEGEVPGALPEGATPAGSEAGEAEEPPEAEKAEIPDWLAALRPRDVEEGEREAPLTDWEEEVPDWSPDLSPEGEPFALPEAEEGVIPPWLGGLQPQEFGEAEHGAPVADREEEIPDWLAEMPLSAEDEIAVPPEVPETEEWVIPDWLAELRPQEADESAERELPPWLAELRIPDEDEEEAIPAAAVPDWLQDLPAPESGEPSSLAERGGEQEGPPEWLVPSERDQEETLARAEIPEWLLALKPTELREEGETEAPEPTVVEQPPEETGLLAGLQGTLPVEMIIAQPRAIADLAVTPGPRESDAPQARLFADIVGRQLQAEPKTIVQPKRQRLARLPRWIIYVALIVVVTFPLLWGEPLLPRNLEAAPPVQDLYDEIESLEDGAPVLVAFDYDPSTSDEMDVVGQVLIDHLMEQQARIVAVSLYPAGPPMAQAVLDELAVQRPDYAGAYGESYVNLGYLPGQATAVRLLGQSLPVALPWDFQETARADLPLAASIGSMQDFSLIVDLAATEQSVRWWVEQAATPYNVPLAGGVSASVVPLAQPYYQTDARQLVGLVGGLPDAAAYASLRGDQAMQGGALAARLDALTGGHVVFILLLTIGTVVQLLRGSGGGR